MTHSALFARGLKIREPAFEDSESALRALLSALGANFLKFCERGLIGRNVAEVIFASDLEPPQTPSQSLRNWLPGQRGMHAKHSIAHE